MYRYRSLSRGLLATFAVLALFALTGGVLADGPVEGRAGRAEIRYLEGMIDHHQMALDMANHALVSSTTDEVRALSEAIIAAQTAEIGQMQGWLRDWYGIDYQPVSMLGIESVVTSAPVPAPAEGGMAGMMDMMQSMMGEAGMMDMMQGMMSGEMSPEQMQMMMQMMQMMMGGMGGTDNAPGMGMVPAMPGMSSIEPAATPEATAAPDDHAAHHPATESAEAGALVSDPAMSVGMMAGLDRLTGLDYDLAWLEAMVEHHDGAIHMSERLRPWVAHDELAAMAETIIRDQTAEIEQMEALIAEWTA